MATPRRKQPVWRETLRRTPGLRLTKQRCEVYRVLLETRDHPTAALVYERVRKRMPSVSPATVYNCLDALAEKKLVNQVTFDRGPSRYCPNLVDHVHLMEEETGEVTDVFFQDGVCLESIFKLPKDVEISNVEIYVRVRKKTNEGNEE